MRALSINLGARFGRLCVVAVFSDSSKRVAHCICKCGTAKDVAVSKLVRGQTASCGCIRKEKAAALKLKHGSARSGKLTPEYRVWNGMVSRCHTASSDTLKAYHHRGVAVCDRWRFGEQGISGFGCFLADMGRLPSAEFSIERRDNSRGYEPDNCYWLPRSKQNRNKRNTRWVLIDGEHLSFIEAVERFGKVPAQLAYTRVSRGWDDVKAITTPKISKEGL